MAGWLSRAKLEPWAKGAEDGTQQPAAAWAEFHPILKWKATRLQAARAAAPCIMPLYSTVLLRLIRSAGLNAQPVKRLMSGYRFAPGRWPGPERLWLSASFFVLGLLFPSVRAGQGRGGVYEINPVNQYIELLSCLGTRAPPPSPPGCPGRSPCREPWATQGFGGKSGLQQQASRQAIRKMRNPFLPPPFFRLEPPIG